MARISARAINRARKERQWYEEHGGSEAGYIERYGEPGVTEQWYGEANARCCRAESGFEAEPRGAA